MPRLTTMILVLMSLQPISAQKAIELNADKDPAPGDMISIYLPSFTHCFEVTPGPRDVDSLQPLANFLNHHRNFRFELQCHTDSRGDEEKNREITQARAEDIRRLLVNYYGVDSAQVTAKGYGETMPLVTDAAIKTAKTKEEKEALHAKNRRQVLLVKERVP